MNKQKWTYRIIILILLLALCTPLLPSALSYGETIAPPEGFTGIYTAQDLSDMRNNLSGKYILMNDLNLTAFTATGDGWLPVGTKDVPFTGILDGNGHTITGLRIYKPIINTVSFVGGLFGYAKGMQVRDLTLTANFDVTVMRANRYNYLGGLVGYGSGLHISGTTVTLKAKARAETVSVGGLIGYADASSDATTEMTVLENCSVSGEINGMSKDFDLGGLVGRSVSLKVTGCSNLLNLYGLVTVENLRANIGGIVGTVQSFEIIDCINKGKVTPEISTRLVPTSAGASGGGIAGRMTTGETLPTPLFATITGSVNEETVGSYQKGGLELGGIAGNLTDATVTDCVNKGKVISSGLKSEGSAGGILNRNNGGTISGCTNEGNIAASGGGSAGIATFNMGTIEDCINTGDVGASLGAGGICFENNGVLRQCFNTGYVSQGLYGDARCGGIVAINTTEVTDCYNIGQIISDAPGGIVGENVMETSIIARCYNTGVVKSTNLDAGGIAAFNQGIITDSFYYGILASGVGANTGTNQSAKLSYTQLLNAASFAGFDFTEDETPAVWVKSPNSGLPALIGLPEVYLTSLGIQRKPLTYSYLLNETASLNGLCLKATYSNGKTTLLDYGFTMSPNAKTIGDQTLTANYMGKTASTIIHYDKWKLYIEDSTVIRVEWTPVPKATQMKVYLANASAGPYKLVTTASANGSGIGYGDLTYGKVYCFKIRPMYGTTYGTMSPYAAIRMKPNAPDQINTRLLEEGVFVTWGQTVYAEDYELYYSQKVEGPYVKLATTHEYPGYRHTTAAKGTRYYYLVRSFVVVDGIKVYGDFSGIGTALNL